MSIFKPKWHRSAGHRLQKPGWLIVAIAPSACGRGASEPQGVPAGAIDGDGVVAAGGGHSGGLRTDNTITCWDWNSDGPADAPGV